VKGTGQQYIIYSQCCQDYKKWPIEYRVSIGIRMIEEFGLDERIV